MTAEQNQKKRPPSITLEAVAETIAKQDYLFCYKSDFPGLEWLKEHNPDSYENYWRMAVAALQAFSPLWSDDSAEEDDQRMLPERVAEAIHSSDQVFFADEDEDYTPVSWAEENEVDQDNYRANARAALEACRFYYPPGQGFVVVTVPKEATNEQADEIFEVVAEAVYTVHQTFKDADWDPMVYGWSHPYGPEGARLMRKDQRDLEKT